MQENSAHLWKKNFEAMPMDKLDAQSLSHIATYLRAVDLVQLRLICKSIFTKEVIQHAVYLLLQQNQGLIQRLVNAKRLFFTQLKEKVQYTPKCLYLLELSIFQLALHATTYTLDTMPPNKPFYWISSSWLSSMQKQCNALLALPQNQLHVSNILPPNALPQTPGKQKKSPMKAKKTSNSPKPKESQRISDRIECDPVNADLYCQPHDALTANKDADKKKKLISRFYWHLLLRFAPVLLLPSTSAVYRYESITAISLPVAHYTSHRCLQCSVEQDLHEEQLEMMLDTERARRRSLYLPRILIPVYHRKQGVPTHCLPPLLPTTEDTSTEWMIVGTEFFINDINDINDIDGDELLARQLAREEEVNATATTTIATAAWPCPLASGLYHLVSRTWLRHWRRYVKDPAYTPPSGLPRAPPSTTTARGAATGASLDASALLCTAHGCLRLPGHVREYLYGTQSTLFNHYAVPVLPSSSLPITTAHRGGHQQQRNQRGGVGGSTGGVPNIQWDRADSIRGNSGNSGTNRIEEQYEIVTVEEYDALLEMMMLTASSSGSGGGSGGSGGRDAMASYLAVKFYLDQEVGQIEWNIPVCHICSPVV